MADQLTAKFRLAVEDGLSSPLEHIQGLFAHLEQTIANVGNQSAFAGLDAAITRNIEAMDRLNATMERVASAERQVGGAGVAMGEEIAAGAMTATAGLERVQAQLRAISAESILPEAAGGMRDYRPLLQGVQTPFSMNPAVPEPAVPVAPVPEPFPTIPPRPPVPPVPPAPPAPPVPPTPRFNAFGYGRDVVHGVRHLGEATEQGVGRAFGAAAAGFGLIEPIRAAAEFNNSITHIGITLNKRGADLDRFVTQFGKQLDAVARATGQTGEKLADAASFFSQEGYSLAKINAVLPTVAHISTAYNADPDAVAKTTFALQENMKIDDKALPQALAEVALVGKSAALPFEKLAPLFPEVAAQAGALGVHGTGGVRDLGAMLAVVRKNVGTEGEATTDVRSFMQAITSPHTAKRFAKLGVDLFGVISNANKQGLDPLEAVLAKVDAITHRGKDLKAVGELFNNEQDRGFVNALMQHLDQYFEIKAKLDKANPKMVDEDFSEGMKSLRIQTQAFGEALEQLMRRAGVAFAPIMGELTIALHHVIDAFDWLDKHMPGATTAILGSVGGMLALATVLGAIGAVLPPILAGGRLILIVFRPLAMLVPLFAGISLGAVALGAAILAIAGIFVAAGVDIYRHWDRFRPFFAELGHGIIAVLSGMIAFVADVFLGRWSAIPAALGHAWGGLKQIFGGLLGILKGLFTDFLSWVESWGKDIPEKILAGLTSAWDTVVSGFHHLVDELTQPLTDFETTLSNSWLVKHLVGSADGTPAPAMAVPAAPSGGSGTTRFSFDISHPPGTTMKQTGGPASVVRTTTNRGQMVGRS